MIEQRLKSDGAFELDGIEFKATGNLNTDGRVAVIRVEPTKKEILLDQKMRASIKAYLRSAMDDSSKNGNLVDLKPYDLVLRFPASSLSEH